MTLTTAASRASTGAFALNQTGPPSVGTRMTVAHGRTWGCSIAPVTVAASSSTRS
ncbi:MAG: hypothetical protein ACRDNE_06905 [Gaiellaceae bacterium]